MISHATIFHLTVAARIQDAGSVFREPLRAVMWQEDILGTMNGIHWQHVMSWTRSDGVQTESQYAVVWNDPPITLDLQTGSRRSLMWDPPKDFATLSTVRLWQTHSVFPGEPNRYLVVTNRGLEAITDNDDPPPVLLLAQSGDASSRQPANWWVVCRVHCHSEQWTLSSG